jgi:cysteine-rich repeat protein
MLAAAVLGAPAEVSAQSCPAGQRCYYIPPHSPTPTNFSGIGWDLVISSSIGTVNGTYRFGAGAPVAFSATPGAPTIIALSTTNGVAANYHTVETRGVFVEADNDLFVATRMITGPWQDSASIKESSFALGTRFRAGGYALNGLNNPNTGHDMISVYAPTGASVTFTAPEGVVGNFWQGVVGPTHTVSLAAGETFIIRTPGNSCTAEVDGALVTATAPIAVISGGRGWSGICGASAGCGDDGFDNILPTNQWGNIFTITNYPGANTGGEDVRVVADTDGTMVLVNDVLVATLDAGETHTFEPAGVSLIETSNPVAVYHNAAASLSACELGLSFVAPMEFRGSTSLNVAVNVSGTGTAAVTIETPRVASVRLDGAVLVAPTVTVVPGRPDVSVVTFNIPGGNHVVSSSGDFQMGMVTGISGTGLFAYYNPFRVPGCGNGQLDGAESCDDGGIVNGDGCSSGCRIEIGTGVCTTDAQCVSGGHCDMMGICRECVTNDHCDDTNSCTSDACVANVCVPTSLMQGELCAGGICNGAAMNPACVGCVDTQLGTTTDLGCSAGSPQCTAQGGGVFACVGCTGNGDCNDSNACTTNTCAAGTCTFPPVMAGVMCTLGAGNGVCNGSVGTPACEVCVDNAPVGMTDAGCTNSAPLCDRSNDPAVCVECLSTSDCNTSGEICVAGTCDDPSITYVGPTGNILALTATPNGVATHLPNGTLLSVTVTQDNGMGAFMCTGVVSGGVWSCAVDGITGLVEGGEYSVSVTGTVDGVMVSAMGGFDVVECLVVGDCNDSNLCTTDACTAGACVNAAVAEGMTGACTGGAVCSGAPTNLCVACTDTSTMGTDAGCMVMAPHCRTTGSGSPSCEACLDDATGLDVDLGCSMGNPLCVGGTCVACETGADCGDGNSCTQNLCMAGVCSNPPVMEGTPCATGVCDTTALCEACVDNGSGTDLGCDAMAQHCIGASGSRQCVVCTDASHCDDSSLCTVDSCASNACDNAPVAAGDTGMCTGGEVCSGDPTNVCLPCADTDATGTDAGCMMAAPHCDPGAMGGNTCEVCVDGGAGTDLGCDAATPNCVVGTGGANECISCLSDGECDDGIECTTDTCSAGACTNPAVAEFTPCSTGVCTAASSCEAVAVSIDGPVDGTTITDAMPTILGTGTPGTTVTVSIGGTMVGTAVVDAMGAWSLPLTTPLSEGLQMVTASVTVGTLDAMDMSSFTVDTGTVVLIESPADGSTTLDATPLITGTGEPGATVVITVDGEQLGSATVDTNGNWVFAVLTRLTNDVHTVEAVATDLAGNTDTATSTFTVNSSTDLAITGPVNGSVINDNTPSISGTTRPGASVTVVINIDGTAVTIGTVVADTDGNWLVGVTQTLLDGPYVVTATATDLEGNMAADSASFTVDTATEVTIGDVDPTTGVITGTGEPGAEVVITVDGVEVGTVTVGVDGTWSFDGDVLGAGSHTVTATATDPAGNTATDTTTVTVASPDGGMLPDGGVGGLSGGALCATHAPVGASWPAAGGLLLVGLALATRRRRR